MQKQTSLIQKARSHFGCANFERILDWYKENGYVYIGPDAIIFAQTHSKSSLCSEINEQKELDKDDCWYVQYATGRINRFFAVCPFRLEWVVFERLGNKKRKAYKFDRLARYCNGRT